MSREQEITTPCPPEASIEQVAIATIVGDPDANILRHIHACAVCGDRFERYRQEVGRTIVALKPASRHNSGECPDEEAIARFLDKSLSGEASAAIVAHLDSCIACRATMVSLHRGIKLAESDEAVDSFDDIEPFPDIEDAVRVEFTSVTIRPSLKTASIVLLLVFGTATALSPLEPLHRLVHLPSIALMSAIGLAANLRLLLNAQAGHRVYVPLLPAAIIYLAGMLTGFSVWTSVMIASVFLLVGSQLYRDIVRSVEEVDKTTNTKPRTEIRVQDSDEETRLQAASKRRR